LWAYCKPSVRHLITLDSHPTTTALPRYTYSFDTGTRHMPWRISTSFQSSRRWPTLWYTGNLALTSSNSKHTATTLPILPPTPYLMWRRTDGVSPRFIETESTYPQGIGLVCPWSAVSPYGERGPLAGGHWPLPIYNSHATVFHRVDTSCECTLLTDKAHIHAKRSKGLAAPLGDDPVNPENPQSDEAHRRAASGTASPAGPFDRL